MKKNIKKCELFKKMCNNSSDYNVRNVDLGKITISCIFFESTSSSSEISELIIKSLINKKISSFSDVINCLENSIYNSKMKKVIDINEAFYYLASGFCLVCADNTEEMLVFESRAELDRGVVEASSEPVLRGPKDSFTENHSKNLGLIRKRIKDPNLSFDEMLVGRRTQTKVTLSYIRGVCKEEKVTSIKNRIKSIDVDGILDSGYIRDYLSSQKTTFPEVISTERPDLVAQALLEGKFVIMVENSPFVIILPGLFIDFLHTSEDHYQKASNISFTRILKILAFIITLLTPSIYIALMTFNPEVIPDKLLISLAVQREGVPFPTAIEVILLITIFEILRECDIRTPTTMGTSISIVGALVLGESAVNAGIVSPIVVIVVAFTSICSLLFTDIDFINGIRFWRGLFIIGSTFLGIIGFISISILFIVKLSSMRSLGVDYLSPVAPFNLNLQKDALVKFPDNMLKTRAPYLSKNRYKEGGHL